MDASIQVSCGMTVTSLAVTLDGTIWVGGDTLSCWREGTFLWNAGPGYSQFQALSFKDGLLWAGCCNGTIILVRDFEFVELVFGHYNTVNTLWATSNKSCFSGGNDNKIKKWVWDGVSVTCVWTSPKRMGHKQPIYSVCEDLNGKLWSGGGDGTVKCWENNQCIRTLRGHSGQVTALAVGSFLYSEGDNGIINCWTLEGEHAN